MQRTLDSLALQPVPDRRKHCLASAAITLRCGTASAVFAGFAKESADLVGPGDASLADLAADAAGRRCARRTGAGQALAECCSEAGF